MRSSTTRKGAGLMFAAMLLGGCGGDSRPGDGSAEKPAAPVLTAATLGEQVVRSNADYLAAAPYASADRENGERQARLCRACHTLEQGGANMIGPNLYGFFGRDVGVSAAFDYSAAIREADFVWTPRALDAWLQQPARFLPGNRMSFAGVRDAGDRADLIAFLLEATGNGTDAAARAGD